MRTNSRHQGFFAALRMTAFGAAIALAGCTPIHSKCVQLDSRVGDGWVCAYDVATSRTPWAVQHRYTAALPANPHTQITTEDEASLASQIESAAGPIGEAAKIVQPTAQVP